MARLRSVVVALAGERVELRGDASLYWPRERMLVVADLHLGKTESLRRDGAALPDGVMDHDLARLAAAVRETGAQRVVVIGDLIHDAAGLTSLVRTRFASWRRQLTCSVELVPGNHDQRVASMPEEWGLVVHGECLEMPPFTLRHEPAAVGGHLLCGHLHPAIRLSGGLDGARVPCFHLGAAATVLPAFTPLTGGAPVQAAPGDRVVPVVDGWVFEPLPV